MTSGSRVESSRVEPGPAEPSPAQPSPGVVDAGFGLGATEVLWENARPQFWAPVAVGGDLYLLPTNVHAGAYALTRADFEAVAVACPGRVLEKREKRPKREIAAGWHLYLHCGRRKAIPARRFHAFLVHHLTDRNWWERSACAAPLQSLAPTGAGTLSEGAFFDLSSDVE